MENHARSERKIGSNLGLKHVRSGQNEPITEMRIMSILQRGGRNRLAHPIERRKAILIERHKPLRSREKSQCL